MLHLSIKPAPVAAAFLLMTASCGTRTSGFFSGPLIGREPGTGVAMEALAPELTDTLLNCSFNDITDAPFGPDCRFEVYHGGLHIDNTSSGDPLVLLSTAALTRDGIVEAVFQPGESSPHAILGLVLRAEDDGSFLLAGVDSRGQYTIQRCLGSMWTPVMGLDPFESSRLLPYDPTSIELTAEIHGNYVDFYVNGQLLQVVRTPMPVMGRTGVFVDGWTSAVLDRITIVPES